MFMLQGLAGTGKSAIAHTICQQMDEWKLLGVSFFFSQNDASYSNLFLVFPTIAYQKAIQYRPFHQSLTQILKEDPDVVGLMLEMQLKKLMVKPLCAAAEDIGSIPVVVIIDTLDECSNYKAQIMSLLCNICPRLPIYFKFFILFQPEHKLQTIFSSHNIHLSTKLFILHDVDASVMRGDIEHFLRYRLSRIATRYPNIINFNVWPAAKDISTLTKKSDKLFIFTATVVKFIEDSDDNPKYLLNVIMNTPPVSGPSPYKHLDQLFKEVIEHAVPERASKQVFDHFRTVMDAITVLYDTFTIPVLGHLLRMELSDIHMALLHLHSLVIVPNDQNKIHLIHPSFCDFMT
jgi:hypothetical protein